MSADRVPSRAVAPWEPILREGHALEAAGRFTDAIAAYEHIIVAFPGDPRAFGLGWMNRGNALQKIAATASQPADAAEALAAATTAYDRAIEAFTRAPTSDLVRNHLGAACLNRGHAHWLAGNAPAAITSLEAAITHLSALPIEADASFRLNLAGAYTNLCQALLQAPQTSVPSAPGIRAAESARQAIHLLRPLEATHDGAVELSVAARRALVLSLGQQRAKHSAAAKAAVLALVSEATDTIEESLSLLATLEHRGDQRLRPLATRFFHLGTQLYREEQPQFLSEFVLEVLSRPGFSTDPDFRAIAHESVTAALAEAERPRVLVAGTQETERLLGLIQELRAAHEALVNPGPSTESVGTSRHPPRT